VRLGTQITEALAHAHSRGIVHRDLKPANIVCDAAGGAKILDFGIARWLPREVAEDLTTTGAPVDSAFAGTLAYMAPEVVRGEGQDERSDLWSLGVVLYEMTTGRRPFQGTNVIDVASAIVRDAAPQLPHEVAAPFSSIVMRLLAKSPVERYRTAGEVVAALELLSSGQREAVPRARDRRRLMLTAILAVGAIAIALLVWRRDTGRPLTITQQQLLSTPEAAHRSPAYAPDGSRIAFTAPDAGGVEQIWVRNIASGGSIQLTHERVAARRPRWLPNDRLLYAVSGQGLWVIPALGGTPTRLIERGANPDVSRDGTRIVFEEPRRGLWTAASDGSDVRRIDGTAPVYYTIPMGPALSPDGSQVAYFHAVNGPNGDFWVIPSAGGTPRRLTSDLREGGWPVWTPDGNAVVFSSARAGSRTLWQIPARGGEPVPLTSGAGDDDQPDVSLDGQRLAYVNVRNTWELRTRDLSNGVERTLMRRGLHVTWPIFSPDGRRIAYFSRADRAIAIFTIGVDGSDPRQLTGGNAMNHMPRWGADGQDVYFFQVQPTLGFRRMPAVGGPDVEFRPWDWQVHNAPHFDPKGQFIAYVRQRAPGASRTEPEHTVIHEVATGRERLWPEPHTHVGGWSPDGESIYGWQHDPNGARITVCRVTNGTCRPVTLGRTPKWSAADNRMYFVRSAGAVQQLWSANIEGTDERVVADLGRFGPLEEFFDVSPGGVVVWAAFLPGVAELWTAALASR
ncbi:MAG: PD40 domain-containing protein, partial [Acidobacteria bacterium]|nr:PD40 domain-containing protein [Acidobacteriota bacterium]